MQKVTFLGLDLFRFVHVSIHNCHLPSQAGSHWSHFTQNDHFCVTCQKSLVVCFNLTFLQCFCICYLWVVFRWKKKLHQWEPIIRVSYIILLLMGSHCGVFVKTTVLRDSSNLNCYDGSTAGFKYLHWAVENPI